MIPSVNKITGQIGLYYISYFKKGFFRMSLKTVRHLSSICFRLLSPFSCLLPVILLFLIFTSGVPAEEEMRGIWVATVSNLDYPVAPTASSEELARQADMILDYSKACGFNAVFLQVRPCSDAFYASDLYPWSAYLTGVQGNAPDSGFDPLTYWVNGAHARGMELHAWINPYRITKTAADWERLSAASPAIQHPDWVVYHNGNYYFDPALPKVRQFLIDGAAELAAKYDIDGIHMDDYFYPGTDFNDAASFAAYGNGFTNISDWRRNNVNLLIQGMDEVLHNIDPDIQFGISPAGIWASRSLHPAGSATTSTYSSYFSLYADSKQWVEAGWVDYIAPQIYWEAGHRTSDFNALTDWWTSVTDTTDVKLYIGLADYKSSGITAPDSPWYNGTEIARQIALCHANPQVAGVIHFRYGSVVSSPMLTQILVQSYSG